jgi:hypothetical protein
MKNLPENWLTAGLIDFEYKKYLLLDYLTNVKTEFGAQRLYPAFSDLILHYQNLQQIWEHKKLVYEQFPQRISQADFEKLELVYQKIVEDDETMREIEDILEFAGPRFNTAVSQGREIYDFIESNLEITPVGITPIYHDAGYLFLETFPQKETQVYQFQISVFQNSYEKYRGLNLAYLETIRRGLTDTYENLKIGLTRKNKALPNPATFAVIAKIPCPFEHSLLPIAKRSLLKYVSNLPANLS